MQFTKALQHTIVWRAFNTLLTFCINLLLVRIMGAEYSGVFFYAITALSFFTLAMSWSMEAGITYYGSNDTKNIPSIMLFIIPWILLQGIVSWFLLSFVTVTINRQLSWLYVFSNLVITYFSALYYSRKWFVSVNVIVCVVNCLVLIFLGWIYVDRGMLSLGIPPGATRKRLYDSNFAGAIYLSGFLLQALLLAMFFIIRQGYKFAAVSFNAALTRKVFFYSSIAFVSNLLFFLVTRIDYYFVQKYCDNLALSNYVQVSKIGQLIILLPSMIAAVIFPYSSAGDEEDYLKKLQVFCRVVTLLFIPVGLLIIVFGYWLFPWLFGPGFNLMYPAFLWYLPGFYSLSLVTLLASYLAGKKMPGANLAASAITLVLVVAGDGLLIPNWGINAAAGISSLAYVFCLVYLLRIFRAKFGIEPLEFFNLKRNDLKIISGILKK